MSHEKETSLETLQEIRSIMDRSVRFLSLSGWSGIWAGCIAFLGAFIAYTWLADMQAQSQLHEGAGIENPILWKFLFLGVLVFIAALVGGFFFTYRKIKRQGQVLWNAASRRLTIEMMIPLLAGGIFVTSFLYHGHAMYIAATCLVFYGLALINASKYTLADIRYLGFTEIILGCICIYFPGDGLYFWAAGFGLAHMVYGLIMWNKYDRKEALQA